MRFFHHFSLLATFATFATSTAHATVLCEYAAFTPTAFHHYITTSLAGLGVAVVPAKYFTERADPNEFAVVRDSRLFGHLRVARALAGAKTSLFIEDPHGTQLAKIESDTFACAGGWCRSSDLTSMIDVAPNFDLPALRISQEPTYGLKYLVYGEEVGVTDWRSQFDDRLNWTIEALTDDSTAVDLVAFTPTQSLYLALATDPTVAPYLSVISITTDRGGRLVVRGRVPHSIYDLIIDSALRAGFYNISPDMIIDSAAYMVPVSTDPDMQRCFYRFRSGI